jgi:hypothetical protein
VVVLPVVQAAAQDVVALLQLRIQEGRDQPAGEAGRADIDPGVLVHLTAQEGAAAGDLLADDLGPLDPRAIVDQQRATLAGDDVLGLA